MAMRGYDSVTRIKRAQSRSIARLRTLLLSIAFMAIRIRFTVYELRNSKRGAIMLGIR